MSRTLIVSNLLLALIVALQAWWLHAARPGPSAAAASPGDATEHPSAQVDVARAPGIDAHLLSMQLARIEQRLVSLEAQGGQTPAAQGHGAQTAPAAPEPTMSNAEADRRLAELLPVSTAGREDLERYRARLAMLPPAQQAAVEAALSRAINQDRLRLRL